jgi:putative ABC transport system permease protein
MKSILALAWHSLWSRRFGALLTVVCVALGSAVLLTVERLRADARESFVRSISGTDLIVGPRSGSLELLLATVFHTGTPGRGMDYAVIGRLAKLPPVEWVAPLAFGDNYRGYPVLGTTTTYFERFRYGRGQPLRLAAGRFPTDVYDATVGADLARRYGLALGDKLTFDHGHALEAGGHGHDHADMPFSVAGILQATGTAADRTVFVGLDGIEAMHIGWDGELPPTASARMSAQEARLQLLGPERVSAALVGLRDRAAVLAVQQAVARDREPLSAILPGVALLELWELVGAAESVLRAMSWGVVAVVLIGLVTVLWSGLDHRRREMAVLRAVGARPAQVASLIVGEATLLTGAGVALGALLAAAAAALARPWLEARYGLVLAGGFGPGDLALLAALLVVGVVAGAIPAWRCYRMTLADGLAARV